MRMWMVHPRLLCDKHLLGEHVELHMLVGCIIKGKSLKGYIEKGLVNLTLIRVRHEDVIIEMLRRGFSHLSPLPDFSVHGGGHGYVISSSSIRELKKRCRDCRRRIKEIENL